MFELSGVNYEGVLEQGDSILVGIIASSSYRGFELSGLYCIYIYIYIPVNSRYLEYSVSRILGISNTRYLEQISRSLGHLLFI